MTTQTNETASGAGAGYARVTVQFLRADLPAQAVPLVYVAVKASAWLSTGEAERANWADASLTGFERWQTAHGLGQDDDA